MRRWVFESLMRGPFIVAPFINIVVKAIIPKAAGCLDRSCGRPLRRSRFAWLGPARGILRFMTLIFTYDGKRVGCLAFVCRGGPFAPLAPDLPEREVAEAALEQFKMKPFEVEEELMEIEMTLLWLVFFMPLLPGGVIVTMVAKLAEVSTDLTKLLFVNRRPVPVDDVAMRREISTYAWCVVVTGLAWTLGLSLVTYNDDLYKWGYGGVSVFLAMVAFMFAGSVAMTRTVKRCTVRSRVRRDVRVCPENPAGSATSAEDPGTCG
uniref:Uncharacterized protein n=1 Tax=Alexandrium catenella TaxID=2925 RepID=A0A7S1R3E9_ALECA|mmetsp:Transcript_43826/g.118243  ORF Transcript_43826/g.118243 Transcript_43826/m.118243 type:complete len:264 (+) Transcript_43826:2-793(+)